MPCKRALEKAPLSYAMSGFGKGTNPYAMPGFGKGCPLPS